MEQTSSRLLLLRHAESTWNVAGLWQGQADPPLSESGVKSASALVASLESYDFRLVCSSDLARARQTAEILARGLSLKPPLVDARLRERDVGRWAGLTDAEIERGWPGKLAEWRIDDDYMPAGGGEDSAVVASRATACLDEMLAVADGNRLLAVSHAGTIRVIDRAWGGTGGQIPNLGGRWFQAHGGILSSGGVFDAFEDQQAAQGRL